MIIGFLVLGTLIAIVIFLVAMKEEFAILIRNHGAAVKRKASSDAALLQVKALTEIARKAQEEAIRARQENAQLIQALLALNSQSGWNIESYGNVLSGYTEPTQFGAQTTQEPTSFSVQATQVPPSTWSNMNIVNWPRQM